MKYKDKKIFILGLARSGYCAAKLLAPFCNVVLTDSKEDKEKTDELEALGVECIITKDQASLLDDTFDYVIKNQGISYEVETCVKARSLNIPIINEAEMAYEFLKEKNVKIIGITGSNGKTTTTTLIYEVLKKADLKVHLGGNIGIPISGLVNDVEDNDILVLEIAAQQLMDFKDFKIDIAILTNLVEAHLDYFKTYDYYKECKKRIFKNSTLGIVNAANQDSVSLTKDLNNLIYFDSLNKNDIYVTDSIYYKDEFIINVADIKLQGIHNLENIMCMIVAVKELNVSNEVIKEVLTSFGGVEHRLEFVKEINGVKFYNDSKSTNVEATKTALKAFISPVILLLGGLDRNHSFDELLEYMQYTKSIISYGETKDRIFDFCNKNSMPCSRCETLKEAVLKANQISKEGDVVLLSPACASWDQYDKFESRGEDFKKTVSELQ